MLAVQPFFSNGFAGQARLARLFVLLRASLFSDAPLGFAAL
jgi:hypothetical protein